MKTKINQTINGIKIDNRLVEKLETYTSLVMDFIAEGNPSTAKCWNNDIKVAYNLLLNRYCLANGIELNRRKQRKPYMGLSELLMVYKHYRPL